MNNTNKYFDKQPIQKFLLNPNKSFKIIKLKYLEKEKKCIKELNVKNSLFNYFGLLDALNFNNIKDFFSNLDNNVFNCQIITRLIKKLAKQVCSCYKKKALWLKIESSTPNNKFDMVRWHYDGNYYKIDDDMIQTKFITTLKGPGTLLIEPNQQLRQKFEEIFFNMDMTVTDDTIRKQVRELLKNNTKKQLKNNEGTIFITANKLYNKFAIHSEPPINEDRIFLSIMVGTEEQIEELKQKFNKKN